MNNSFDSGEFCSNSSLRFNILWNNRVPAVSGKFNERFLIPLEIKIKTNFTITTIKQDSSFTVMHRSDLRRYVLPSTRGRRLLSLILFNVRLFRFTQLVENKTDTVAFFPSSIPLITGILLKCSVMQKEMKFILTLLMRFSGLGRSCSGSSSAATSKNIRLHSC